MNNPGKNKGILVVVELFEHPFFIRDKRNNGGAVKVHYRDNSELKQHFNEAGDRGDMKPQISADEQGPISIVINGHTPNTLRASVVVADNPNPNGNDLQTLRTKEKHIFQCFKIYSTKVDVLTTATVMGMQAQVEETGGALAPHYFVQGDTTFVDAGFARTCLAVYLNQVAVLGFFLKHEIGQIMGHAKMNYLLGDHPVTQDRNNYTERDIMLLFQLQTHFAPLLRVVEKKIILLMAHCRRVEADILGQVGRHGGRQGVPMDHIMLNYGPWLCAIGQLMGQWQPEFQRAAVFSNL